MPCNDGGSRLPEGWVSESQLRELEGMLCSAISMLEDFYGIGKDGTLLDYSGFLDEMAKVDPRLVSWYQNHTKAEESKVKRQAAAKLTARERRLLGVDQDGNPIKKSRSKPKTARKQPR